MGFQYYIPYNIPLSLGLSPRVVHINSRPPSLPLSALHALFQSLSFSAGGRRAAVKGRRTKNGAPFVRESTDTSLPPLAFFPPFLSLFPSYKRGGWVGRSVGLTASTSGINEGCFYDDGTRSLPRSSYGQKPRRKRKREEELSLLPSLRSFLPIFPSSSPPSSTHPMANFSPHLASKEDEEERGERENSRSTDSDNHHP